VPTSPYEWFIEGFATHLLTSEGSAGPRGFEGMHQRAENIFETQPDKTASDCLLYG
jgi:hypothetical protein